MNLVIPLFFCYPIPGLSRTVKSSQVLPSPDERWVVMRSEQDMVVFLFFIHLCNTPL